MPSARIYHQKDGSSRESQALAGYAMETNRRLILFETIQDIPELEIRNGTMVSGSIETVQLTLGRKIAPDYLPVWASPFAGRPIAFANCENKLPKRACFLKPPDTLKRFDGFLWHPGQPLPDPPWEYQGVVNLRKEGRHYITAGIPIADGWYSPNPEAEESTCPPLPSGLEIPIGWHGTIDCAETLTGETIIVECHPPFACGWYGESKDFLKYGQWLEAGWHHLRRP